MQKIENKLQLKLLLFLWSNINCSFWTVDPIKISLIFHLTGFFFPPPLTQTGINAQTWVLSSKNNPCKEKGGGDTHNKKPQQTNKQA